jgi:hypothetical protein
MTTNEARDRLIEETPLNTETIRAIKKWAQHAEDERKADPETYAKCPRCYGHHSVRGNFDNLCDGCVKTILEHFPDHESVPHIRAALAKWSNKDSKTPIA